METPEQYTVKTPDEANIKLAVDLYQKYNGILLSFERHIYSSMEEYASVQNAELIKENERLRGSVGVECVKELLAAREENKELLEALKEAGCLVTNHESGHHPSFQSCFNKISDLITKYSKP